MEILKTAIAAELALQSGFVAAGLHEKKLAENLSRPPKPDMGDVMLGCFKLAAEKKLKPNEVAAQLVVGFKPGALVQSVAATGPYVNLRLNRAAAFQAALQLIEQESPGNNPQDWRYGNGDEGAGKTLALDFSSPNIAKPLAVHHLRSTMIGLSIKRIREAQGWRVVGINHLGDWGTAFGRLIFGLKKWGPTFGELHENVKQLNEVYKRFNEELATDQSLADAGKREFAILESALVKGRSNLTEDESANSSIWGAARLASIKEFTRIYAKLGIRYFEWEGRDSLEGRAKLKAHGDVNLLLRDWALIIGESFYVGEHDLCGVIIADAKAKQKAELSDGALVIFTDGKKKPPVILLKNDGATSYHTRDMASALYRQKTFNFDEAAYVVGSEQSLHFQQLFKGLKLLDYNWADTCTHIDFGLMLFKNDEGIWEKTSTRRGTAIMLEDLLDEAVKAVREIIQQKNAELWVRIEAGEPGYADIPDRIGVSAVVFNDLKNGRRNNVKFDWDAVLDFEGESGPYMLYQYVRMGSVLEKYHEKWGEPDFAKGDTAQLKLDAEWNIVLLLADFPSAVQKASREYEPSIVARALIDLAASTSTWWTLTKDTRIVGDDPNLSLARVRLVNAIRKVLGRGLTLLGMQLVERM